MITQHAISFHLFYCWNFVYRLQDIYFIVTLQEIGSVKFRVIRGSPWPIDDTQVEKLSLCMNLILKNTMLTNGCRQFEKSSQTCYFPHEAQQNELRGPNLFPKRQVLYSPLARWLFYIAFLFESLTALSAIVAFSSIQLSLLAWVWTSRREPVVVKPCLQLEVSSYAGSTSKSNSLTLLEHPNEFRFLTWRKGRLLECRSLRSRHRFLWTSDSISRKRCRNWCFMSYSEVIHLKSKWKVWCTRWVLHYVTSFHSSKFALVAITFYSLQSGTHRGTDWDA